MQEYLADHGAFLLQVTFFSTLILAALAEFIIPRRQEQTNLFSRWISNISLAVINQLVFRLSLVVFALFIISGPDAQPARNDAFFNFGFWPSVIVASVILELLGYLIHRAFHAFPFLWRFHAVHHTDTEVDFTTTFRNHPVETILLIPIVTPTFLLLGTPVEVFTLALCIRTVIVTFAHSNIYLPYSADKWLRLFIVTPDFHRLHHSPDQKFTDSNYAIAFPWFDYLFGTSTTVKFDDHPDMLLGLETNRERTDSRLDRLLLYPFNSAN